MLDLAARPYKQSENLQNLIQPIFFLCQDNWQTLPISIQRCLYYHPDFLQFLLLPNISKVSQAIFKKVLVLRGVRFQRPFSATEIIVRFGIRRLPDRKSYAVCFSVGGWVGGYVGGSIHMLWQDLPRVPQSCLLATFVY